MSAKEMRRDEDYLLSLDIRLAKGLIRKLDNYILLLETNIHLKKRRKHK
jgi:hypothetical protein